MSTRHGTASLRGVLLCTLLGLIGMVSVSRALAAATSGRPYRALVVAEAGPGPATEALVTAMAGAGVSAQAVDFDGLLGPGGLGADTVDCVVLTDCRRFPLVAYERLLGFLRRGGDLVLMRGPAFTDPLVKVGAQWLSPAEARKAFVADVRQVVVLDFEDSDAGAWSRGASRSEAPTRCSFEAGHAGKALRLDMRDVGWYDVHYTDVRGSVPKDFNSVCLWAKGDERTPELFIELTEADGSRWGRGVGITTEWAPYLLATDSFLFKTDSRCPDTRGVAGDHLKLGSAVRLTVGLAKDRTPSAGGDHTLWIDDIACGDTDVDLAALDRGLVFRDAFEDYEVYRLRDVVAVTPAPGQEWLPVSLRAKGRFTGLSSLAFELSGESMFLPLLAAHDRYGRTRGWAGGALLNYAGRFPGSQWALFGVEQEAFYRAPAFAEMLSGILQRFGVGDLVERARAACMPTSSGGLRLSTPPPPALEIRDGHFVYPDGRRFFIIGANFFNSFDTFYGGGAQWDVARLERDFQRMQRAGVNAIRIHGFNRFAKADEPHRLETFLELCRRYGVYILPSLIGHTEDFLEKEAMQAEARRIAACLKDEPMVLGYDLQNEPYWWQLSRIRHEGKTLGDMFPVPQNGWRDYQRSLNVWHEDWTSTFPGLKGRLPVPTEARYRQAFDSVNSIYGTWIKWQIEAIRSEDKVHPITVGYNTIYDCLPGNEPLDFVSHHVYQAPTSLEDVRINVTTLDRLKRIWPGRPTTLGEFGYSSGDIVRGRCLDVYSQAVGEFVHFLYALANDYDGVMKWQLCDGHRLYQWRRATWYRKKPEAERVRQRRFGMFVPDGTPEGRPKPIAHATRFLAECLREGLRGGDLELRKGATAIGAGHVFRADNALFVGDTSAAEPGLSFEAEQPANVLLRWGDGAIVLLSTADAVVTLEPGHFVPHLTPGRARVTGRTGGHLAKGERLEIRVLEGEDVRVE